MKYQSLYTKQNLPMYGLSTPKGFTILQTTQNFEGVSKVPRTMNHPVVGQENQYEGLWVDT